MDYYSVPLKYMATDEEYKAFMEWKHEQQIINKQFNNEFDSSNYSNIENREIRELQLVLMYHKKLYQQSRCEIESLEERNTQLKKDVGDWQRMCNF